MTTFLFVRHGEATANQTPEYICGQSNHIPLTELGKKQAKAFGHYLAEEDLSPDAIFSSGAVRADETARIALAQTDIKLPITQDSRVLEMSQGECEGLLRTTIYTPANIEKYEITTDHGKFPGGESLLDVQARMFDFIEEQTHAHPEGAILVFSHGLAIRSLAGKIRNFSKQDILDEITGNVSLTAIQTQEDGHTVHFVGKNVIAEYT
ncbi:histidine phosphatase family protein [Candidatus Saccharibacteria bacterium TM7i]|nr:histidine phosphatase family protein [Candidatus Saccharibacteria bacterium TM7i]